MPSILTSVTLPSEDIRHQFAEVKAYFEEEFLGQGTLCVAESQLSWTLVSNESERQGLAIDYPSLSMHGIVTHDPKYPEAHLVVIVQKSKDEDNDDEPEDEDRSGSPVEYDAIETVNYRFVLANAEDLRFAYQTIADCQALHPDPLDDVVEDDEAGSDIDYGNEDDGNENGNGNGNGHGDADDDPYGYNAHFASMNRGARFGARRRGGQQDNEQGGEDGEHDQNEAME